MAVAILVTQDLKDKNYNFFSNNIVDTIVIKTIPDTFNGVENINAGGYRGLLDLQELDGWKEVVRPSFNRETQKLGNLIDGGNVYTYEVVDLTAQEIEQKTLNKAESTRQQRLQEQTIKQADESFQTITDIDLVLENSDAYPLWRNFDNGYAFNIDFKVQDFNDDNELKVYSVIQAHEKQDNSFPRNVPELFVLVQLKGATEWEVGAAYVVGNIRTYLGIEYICLQSHTSIAGWQPPNIPALWAVNL